MNKKDLVDRIAENANLSKKDSENALNSIMKSIEATMKKKDKLTLVGFGSFTVRKREARMGINPQTRKEIKIPSSWVPVFKAGKGLKEGVQIAKKRKK